MTLGIPATNAALYLIKKVEPLLLCQMPEVANEVGDRMLVTCAAVSLKNCHRFRGAGNVPSLVDHG